MKRSLVAGLCLLAACTTEPRVELEFFDGTITGVVKVIDVFQNTATYTLTVDQNPSFTDPSNPCANRADVQVVPSTMIAWEDTPQIPLTGDWLVPSRKVRVKPPQPTGSGCSRRIEATSILLVRSSSDRPAP